jgi:hypothetical protein
MMRMRLACAAIAIAAMSTGGAASGATIVGTFTPTGFNHTLYQSLALPGAGHYYVTFSLSRAATGSLAAVVTRSWDEYDNVTGAILAGDDNPIEASAPFSMARHGGLHFYYPEGRTYIYPFSYAVEYFHDGEATLAATFIGEAPVNWSLSAERFNPVPEPAAWALMVLGFGAAGWTLRRRQADQRVRS